MKEIFEIASHVSTPLALSGIVIVVLFYLYRQIVAGHLFPQLTQAFSGKIIEGLINKLFILALVAMGLGFAGWVISALKPGPSGPDSYSVSLTSDMTFRQAAEMIAGNDGATITFPECTETELVGKMNAGEMKGDTPKSLLETLQYRVIGSGGPKYRVNYLKAKGLYEIHCVRN